MTTPSKAPQDHLKPAVQRETEEAETVTVTWQGIDLELVAAPDDWDVRTLAAFEEGKAVTAINRLLGPRQADDLANEFRKNTGRPLKVRDYGELMEEIAKIYGFEAAGE